MIFMLKHSMHAMEENTYFMIMKNIKKDSIKPKNTTNILEILNRQKIMKNLKLNCNRIHYLEAKTNLI